MEKKNARKTEQRDSRISRQTLSRIQGFIPDHGKLFQAFMENSPAQAWITSEDCTMFYMNKAYRKTFDLDDECLLRRPVIFPAEYLKLYEENNRKVIRENKPLETLEDGYDQHGDYRIFQVCKFPLGLHAGVPLVGGWMVDVTALNQTNKRHLYVSKATSDVIWEWDLKKQALFLNDGYEKLLGYPVEGTADTLESHIHPDDLGKVKSGIADLLASANEQWQMEYRYIHKDGTIKYVMNKAFVVRDTNGAAQMLIGALQDLTEIRQLEQKVIHEQLQRQKQIVTAVLQAQEHERHNIGTELHDNVNQLIGSARLMIKIAQQEPDKSAEVLKKSNSFLEMAIKEIRELSHRLIAPSMTPEDFRKAVYEISNLLKLSEGIEVAIVLPDVSALENIDPELRLHLYRIIQEQVSNILRHSKATYVRLELHINDISCTLIIADNGVGVTHNPNKRGTGLRNISSRIAIYNGSVDIITEPGKGYEVKIEIPV